MGGATAAELLEAEPIEIDESALVAEAPAALRYGDVPPYLAAGAKGLERALKDRLADKLAIAVLADSLTGSRSEPGESRQSFASRLLRAGGGPRAEKLRDQIEKKRADLTARERDLAGRKSEKWAAIGTAILSNIGLLTGRRRTIAGAGTVLSKNRMESTAEARVQALQAEIAELEAELAALTAVDPARFEQRTLVPARSDVKILRYDVVWVY
jgi:hypothetical protein